VPALGQSEDLFFHVMGIHEIDFWTYIDTDHDLRRFPLLAAIIDAGGDATKVDINNPKIAAELKAFPQRRVFLGSNFIVETIKVLKQKVAALQPSGRVGSIDLIDGYAEPNIMDGVKFSDVRYRLAEALADRRRAAKNYASQVASNFDTLEGGIGRKGALLTGMQHMSVQGENSALCAMAGAIVRKVWITLKKPGFNLLENLKNITVERGRVTAIKNLKESDAENLLVAGHMDLVVSSGYYPPYAGAQVIDDQKLAWDKKFRKDSPDVAKLIEFMDNTGIVGAFREPLYVFNSYISLDQPNDDKNYVRVTQILVSALDIGHGKGSWKPEADILNKWQNIGTVLFAAAHGIEELDLTLLGCGAFGAEPDEIVATLLDDVAVEAIAKTGMKVHIVVYRPLYEAKLKVKEKLDIVRDLVKTVDQKIKNYFIQNFSNSLVSLTRRLQSIK
jgi:hypothetical protein